MKQTRKLAAGLLAATMLLQSAPVMAMSTDSTVYRQDDTSKSSNTVTDSQSGKTYDLTESNSIVFEGPKSGDPIVIENGTFNIDDNFQSLGQTADKEEISGKILVKGLVEFKNCTFSLTGSNANEDADAQSDNQDKTQKDIEKETETEGIVSAIAAASAKADFEDCSIQSKGMPSTVLFADSDSKITANNSSITIEDAAADFAAILIDGTNDGKPSLALEKTSVSATGSDIENGLAAIAGSGNTLIEADHSSITLDSFETGILDASLALNETSAVLNTMNAGMVLESLEAENSSLDFGDISQDGVTLSSNSELSDSTLNFSEAKIKNAKVNLALDGAALTIDNKDDMNLGPVALNDGASIVDKGKGKTVYTTLSDSTEDTDGTTSDNGNSTTDDSQNSQDQSGTSTDANKPSGSTSSGNQTDQTKPQEQPGHPDKLAVTLKYVDEDGNAISTDLPDSVSADYFNTESQNSLNGFVDSLDKKIDGYSYKSYKAENADATNGTVTIVLTFDKDEPAHPEKLALTLKYVDEDGKAIETSLPTETDTDYFDPSNASDMDAYVDKLDKTIEGYDYVSYKVTSSDAENGTAQIELVYKKVQAESPHQLAVTIEYVNLADDSQIETDLPKEVSVDYFDPSNASDMDALVKSLSKGIDGYDYVAYRVVTSDKDKGTVTIELEYKEKDKYVVKVNFLNEANMEQIAPSAVLRQTFTEGESYDASRLIGLPVKGYTFVKTQNGSDGKGKASGENTTIEINCLYKKDSGQTGQNSNRTDGVDTSTQTNIYLYAGIGIAALAAIILIVIRMRRSNNNK